MFVCWLLELIIWWWWLNCRWWWWWWRRSYASEIWRKKLRDGFTLCWCCLSWCYLVWLSSRVWLWVTMNSWWWWWRSFHWIWIRVVNGALEYLAKDLGIADNAVLQGKSCFSYSCNKTLWEQSVECSVDHHSTQFGVMIGSLAHNYWCFWAGWIVSALLAGATVGSFTGGALADKFGRTRTFQLDAIPLAVGAFLWYFFFFQVPSHGNL